jgi:DNA-binding CsgD family transcriptional regulator
MPQKIIHQMNNLVHAKTRLTHREREILTHIADGLSTKQIASKLFISQNTVANHRKNMLLKMGAKNCFELLSRSPMETQHPASV